MAGTVGSRRSENGPAGHEAQTTANFGQPGYRSRSGERPGHPIAGEPDPAIVRPGLGGRLWRLVAYESALSSRFGSTSSSIASTSTPKAGPSPFTLSRDPG
jgi:hypothetical protein